MTIIEQLAQIDKIIAEDGHINRVRLALVKVRVAAQALTDEIAQLRKSREELQRAHVEKETMLRKLVTDQLELLQKSEAPSEEANLKKPAKTVSATKSKPRPFQNHQRRS